MLLKMYSSDKHTCLLFHGKIYNCKKVLRLKPKIYFLRRKALAIKRFFVYSDI
jgi:hypothetical protein